MKNNTQEDFLIRARAVHGDKYDYSESIYRKSNEKLIIICRTHGKFLQTPSKHLAGQGCAKCVNSGLSNTIDFIEKARLVHGDKFDFSLTEYVKASLKVVIICPIHGKFTKTPNHFLRSVTGCPDCGRNLGRISLTDTNETFIKKARAVHGDKYDYSKVVYVNNETMIIIICKIHGEFLQTPKGHLKGRGCKTCAGHGMHPLSYSEAKKIILKFGLNGKNEFLTWRKKNKEYCIKIGIPSRPDVYYSMNK